MRSKVEKSILVRQGDIIYWDRKEDEVFSDFSNHKKHRQRKLVQAHTRLSLLCSSRQV